MIDPHATRTSRLEKTPDGIVIVRINEGVEQSVQDAQDNVASAFALGDGRCALMVDIRAARPLSAETRHYYMGKQLTDYFTALAIVISGSPFGMMMGNVYLRVARPGIPSKLFTDEKDGLDWLRKPVS